MADSGESELERGIPAHPQLCSNPGCQMLLSLQLCNPGSTHQLTQKLHLYAVYNRKKKNWEQEGTGYRWQNFKTLFMGRPPVGSPVLTSCYSSRTPPGPTHYCFLWICFAIPFSFAFSWMVSLAKLQAKLKSWELPLPHFSHAIVWMFVPLPPKLVCWNCISHRWGY